jgi:hypothetical protein
VIEQHGGWRPIPAASPLLAAINPDRRTTMTTMLAEATMSKNFSSPVDPALKALEGLRSDIKHRIGKEGGNLNKLMLERCATIESTLLQIGPLSNMITTLNQQTEVAVHAFRSLANVQRQLSAAHDTNGDDGSSDTKGE